MCGIGGVFNADRQQTVDRQLLVNMAAIQAHRGPDGFGVEVLDQAGVGFCHARLSIIDLNESRARQPCLTDDPRECHPSQTTPLPCSPARR